MEVSRSSHEAAVRNGGGDSNKDESPCACAPDAAAAGAVFPEELVKKDMSKDAFAFKLRVARVGCVLLFVSDCEAKAIVLKKECSLDTSNAKESCSFKQAEVSCSSSSNSMESSFRSEAADMLTGLCKQASITVL